MSILEKYVETVKRKTEGFSEVEKIRYVYLDLGKRFSFDLDFSFGNAKVKRKIYDKCGIRNELEKSMEEKTAICKSISYIFEYILKELGINVHTVKEEIDYRSYPHMYNEITAQDGKNYTFDLQEDLRNIKAHLRTTSFGLPLKKEDSPLINREELLKIDEKLGYVTKELSYTNEYLELIKLNMSIFKDFGEKVQFVLENVDFYNNPDMGYAERKWRIEELIGKYYKDGLLFTKEENRKIHLIDCCEDKKDKKEYELCIAVDTKRGPELYMFSKDINSFSKITMERFAQRIENGLNPLEGVPGLKQFLKSQREDKEEK